MRYVSMMAILCIVFALLVFGTQPAKAANEFSAMGFSLADTPEQVVDKALAKGLQVLVANLRIQRESKDISFENFPGTPKIIFGFESNLLEKFLSYHKRGRYGVGFWNYILNNTIYGDISTTDVWQAIQIESKGVNIIFHYYTLPGGAPKALMMRVNGTIVENASDTFTKRYGEAQERTHANQNMVWMSETECAILNPEGNDQDRLVIISKAGYEELFGKYLPKYLAGLKAEQDAKHKAAAEQQKAQDQALKDKL